MVDNKLPLLSTIPRLLKAIWPIGVSSPGLGHEPFPFMRIGCPRTKTGWCRILPGLFALFGASALDASPEHPTDERILSLNRALEIARAENPRIAIGRARRAGAESALMSSRQGFSPRVTLNAYRLRLDTSLLDTIPTFEPDFPPVFQRDFGTLEGNVASLELIQPLINVGAWNARRQAGRAREAAELELKRARREVDVAVVEAYFGARSARRQVEAEKKGLGTARRALQQAQAGFEEELVAPVDVLSARTRVSEMQARVAAAEARVVAVHAFLHRILGITEEAELILTDPVPEPETPTIKTPKRRRMLSRRRDVRALEQGVEAAEYGVKRARAAWLPDINLYARYDRVDTNAPVSFNENGWLVAVNLSWRPFLGFSQIGALGEAKAKEAETRAHLRALRQQAWAEAQTEHARWQAEVKRWKAASKGVVDAGEALALTEARYAEGLDDMTALLRAQAEELAAGTREISARFNALVAAERYRLAISNDNRRLEP
jgi:outer membrane protein TolC